MDLGKGLALPFMAGLGGLLLAVVAFRDLPLLGSLVGALLSGAVAGLLAEDPRDGARAGFLAGAAVVGFLLAMAFLGPAVFLGSPLLAVSEAVLVAQAAVLGLVPGGAAAVAGRLAAPWRPREEPASAPPAPPGPRR